MEASQTWAHIPAISCSLTVVDRDRVFFGVKNRCCGDRTVVALAVVVDDAIVVAYSLKKACFDWPSSLCECNSRELLARVEFMRVFEAAESKVLSKSTVQTITCRLRMIKWIFCWMPFVAIKLEKWGLLKQFQVPRPNWRLAKAKCMNHHNVCGWDHCRLIVSRMIINEDNSIYPTKVTFWN